MSLGTGFSICRMRVVTTVRGTVGGQSEGLCTRSQGLGPIFYRFYLFIYLFIFRGEGTHNLSPQGLASEAHCLRVRSGQHKDSSARVCSRQTPTGDQPFKPMRSIQAPQSLWAVRGFRGIKGPFGVSGERLARSVHCTSKTSNRAGKEHTSLCCTRAPALHASPKCIGSPND